MEITCPEPRIVAWHREDVVGAAAFEPHFDGDIVAASRFVGDARQRIEQPANIDRGHVLALQFGIEPARVGNVRDQPVEPPDVVLDHFEQPRAAALVARQRQRFDRRTQRGQRILQFMGDVGGEHLDRLDAVIERFCHVAQRAGKMTDFVAAAGEIGNLDAGPDPAADALGAVGKPADGAGDGAGQQQRQHDHHGGGDATDFEDREPFGGHHLVDVVALGREHQRAVDGAEPLHRHSDRDDHLAAVVDAHHAALLAFQRVRDLLVAVAVLGPQLAIERQVAAIEPGPDRDRHPFDETGLLDRRRRQFEAQHVAAAVEAAAVQNEPAVAVIDAGAGLGRRNQPPQHRRDAFRIDGKIQSGGFIRRAVGFAGLEVLQPVGIDGDGVGLDGGRGRDRAAR